MSDIFALNIYPVTVLERYNTQWFQLLLQVDMYPSFTLTYTYIMLVINQFRICYHLIHIPKAKIWYNVWT